MRGSCGTSNVHPTPKMFALDVLGHITLTRTKRGHTERKYTQEKTIILRHWTARPVYTSEYGIIANTYLSRKWSKFLEFKRAAHYCKLTISSFRFFCDFYFHFRKLKMPLRQTTHSTSYYQGEQMRC